MCDFKKPLGLTRGRTEEVGPTLICMPNGLARQIESSLLCLELSRALNLYPALWLASENDMSADRKVSATR